jgi:hypothetical protein
MSRTAKSLLHMRRIMRPMMRLVKSALCCQATEPQLARSEKYDDIWLLASGRLVFIETVVIAAINVS